jgi:hypothetical protein
MTEPSVEPSIGTGWGFGSYGGSSFGAAPLTSLELLSALAIRENVVRLTFSMPVYYSTLLDEYDASDPARFSMTATTGTVGLDGQPVRVVNIVEIVQPNSPDEFVLGTVLDVTTDRPMSPYPASYTIACTALISADRAQLLVPGSSSDQFFGSFKEFIQPSLETPNPSRDFANPQSLQGTLQFANSFSPALLGVFGVDESGDYALDSGIVSYKKRCLRRLVTRPASFLHLPPDYGVGILAEGKKLARASTLQRLSASAEAQIAQEPETERVKVTATLVSGVTGLARFFVVAKMYGGTVVKFGASVPLH